MTQINKDEQKTTHNHSHQGHHHHNHNTAGKNISIAFFLNAIFVVVEVVGGLLTNSIAILSDALHDFGDCLSLATAWFLQKKSTKKRDAKYSYGYKRFSLLGSLFLSGVLSVSSVIVIVEAVKRLYNPQTVDAHGMLWIAIIGIVVNGAAALKVKKGSSLNERAVYLHIVEDVMGWVAVLIGSIVMRFVDAPYIDSLLSIGISFWVLFNVYRNTKSTFHVLLQGTPLDMPIDDLKADLNKISEVDSLHDLHVWSLDGEKHVMTIHVVTNSTDTNNIRTEVVNIAKTYNITHVTVEFENPNSSCLVDCKMEE